MSASPTLPAEPVKFSRYRSVRNAARTAAAKPPSPPPESAADNGLTHRTQSRYRRTRARPSLSTAQVTVGSGPTDTGPADAAVANPFTTPPGSRDVIDPFGSHAVDDDLQSPARGPFKHQPSESKTLEDLTRSKAIERRADVEPLSPIQASKPQLPTAKPSSYKPEARIPRATEAPDSGLGLGIEPGGGGIVPGTDAPISAVNAGERRIKIKCEETFINLPVYPETTTSDLLRAAAARVRQCFDATTSKMVESFTPLGLERPLRPYERIRDVMNSWDRDSQNGLILLPFDPDDDSFQLRVTPAPKTQPAQVSVYLYYSHQPGKWNKRWVTLRSDGQMFVAKKQNAPAKDTQNICHLSDFDIYAPTRRQTKSLKPPKKHCFAVKSQQRSNMFLSTSNYVHFFSTDDREVAGQWYDALHGWRSWYLIDKVGVRDDTDACHVNPPESRATAVRQVEADTLAALEGNRSHSRKASVTSVPTSTHRPAAEGGAPAVSHPRRLSKAPPARDPRGAHLVVQGSASQADPQPFAPGGLLGRSYSQRQKALLERQGAAAQADGPFVKGPNLLNSDRMGVKSHSASETPGLGGPERRASQRGRVTSNPQPLIDLSVATRERRSQAKTGKAFVVDQIPAGGLIDAATGPELSRPITSSSSANSSRYNSINRRRSATQDPFLDPAHEDPPQVFTGLLARAGSRHRSGRGRGVMTGHRDAKEPMIDLREGSQFAPGSLLAEMGEGRSGPVIDRETGGEEVQVETGEGVE